MERDRYLKLPTLEEKNEALEAMQHNLRLVGEENNPVRLNKLKLVSGMLLQRPYNDELWQVVRILFSKQVLVKTVGEQTHLDVWGKRRLVRVPKGMI